MMPTWQERLRDALANETTDRLDFGDDHRNRDPLRFDCGRGRVRSLNKGVNPPPQVALGPLADPAAIDVQRQLGPALDENDAGIDRAQADHPRKRAVLDQIVDDPALQFERDNFEQKDADRQGQQKELVQPARPQHIAEDIGRQRSRRGGIEFMDPGDDAHRPKTINLLQASTRLHGVGARRVS